MNLHGMNVVLIGGSSGIGLATAKLAQEQGATVTIASRSSDKLRHAVKQLGDARAVVADVTSEAGVQAMFGELDRVDHVFVSAGRLFLGRVLEVDLETLRSELDQRLWGPLYVVRTAVPKMTNGSITFMTGSLGSRPRVGAVFTEAMFGATEVLVRGLAIEAAPIRVNAVAGGTIDTPLMGEDRGKIVTRAVDTLPVKRIGLPEDVAQAVMLLMTNSFITGEVLHVDGGGRLV
jgi:NAD(P)-dependent dehydrogenase (short-subunit alcohol dehydrogenase family)